MTEKDYKLIKKALDLARKKHAGQVDKAGDDYIVHPVMVALACDDVETKIVALLHDVLEDTDTTVRELEELGFDKNITDVLVLLNHDKDLSYEDYVRRIKDSGNKTAIKVKLADLQMNMDTDRLGGKKAPKYDLYQWTYGYLNENSDHVFFWKEDEENGFLSNWYLSDFEEDGFIYHSVEQYIMAKKAKLFDDDETYTAILQEKTPSICKKLGRNVRCFDDDVWETNREQILLAGLYLKFTQNYDLEYKLMKMSDKKFAEASPSDKIFGIGLSAEEAKVTKENEWPGRNILGKSLKKTAMRILYEVDPDYYPGKEIRPPHSAFEGPAFGSIIPKGTRYEKNPDGTARIIPPKHSEESVINIKKESIVDAKTDIIVNAANRYLSSGSGVCGAIFAAAGESELEEACSRYDGCPTGGAVITPGFKLCKYIIHAVGPVWKGGKNGEKELLYSCYKRSLDLAKENDCHSITFPVISSGIYGYPKEEAWEVALSACHDWIKDHQEYVMMIGFANMDERYVAKGEQIKKRLG